MKHLPEERLISAYLGLSLDDIFSQRRFDHLVYARRLIFYFLYSRELNGVVLTTRYGQKHSQLSYGLKKLRGQCQVYSQVKNDIEIIGKLIQEYYEQQETTGPGTQIQKAPNCIHIRKPHLQSMQRPGKPGSPHEGPYRRTIIGRGILAAVLPRVP